MPSRRKTPLAALQFLMAAGQGRVDAVRNTLEHWAGIVDVNVRDNSGNTPLIKAASSGSAVTITTLLDAGADVNARNHKGRTALHEAAGWARYAKEGFTVVQALLDGGADVEAGDDDGLTPLMMVSNDPRSVTALLAHGANPNAQAGVGRDRCSVLIHHLRSGLVQHDGTFNNLVQQLLVAGAEPNVQDLRGRSPLSLMVQHNAPLRCVQTLLDHGGNPLQCVLKNCTPLGLARSLHKVDTVSLFEHHVQKKTLKETLTASFRNDDRERPSESNVRTRSRL